MRAKLWWQLAVVLLGTVAFAGASSIGVTLGGSGSTMGGPTQGVYYYPYYLNLSNGTTIMVACDDYFDHVSIGESWTAEVHTMANPTGMLFYNTSSDLVKYGEVAWLFDQFETQPFPDNSVNAAINFAMWDIMDSSAPGIDTSHPTSTNSSTYWVNQAAAAIPTFSTYDFSSFVVYTPTSWTGNDRPQEYIGKLPSSEVPEPTTALLWLSGLGGVAWLGWKQRRCEAIETA